MHNTTDTRLTREERIAELEDVLVDTERQLIALHQSPADLPPPPAPPPPPRGTPNPPPPMPQDGPAAAANLRTAEWWLRISGIAMVVASAIFFVSTAIQRGWIGPTAQLTLATLISLALAAVSFRFDADRRPWQTTLAAGGAASFFASGLVGYVGLDLLSFPVAIGWFIASIALFLGLARAHDSQALLLGSVPTAMVGVILLGSDGLLLPAYLTLLGVGYALAIVTMAHGRGWMFGRSVGVAFGALIGSLGFAGVLLDDGSNEMILALVACLGVVGFAISVSQSIDFRDVERADMTDSVRVPVVALVEARLVAIVIPWLSVVVGLAVDAVTNASIGLAWTAMFTAIILAGLVAISRRLLPLTMQLLHGTAAMATIAVALVSLFAGPTLLAALLGQTIIAVLLALRFRSMEMIAAASVLGILVSVMTMGLVAHGTLVIGLDLAESAVVLAVLATISAAAVFLRENEIWHDAWLAPWLLLLGWASATFRDVSQGQMIVSLIWVFAGSVMVFLGARQRERNAILAGLTTLFVTAGKLVFIDLAAVDVLWRAGLFFAVGAVFMRLAFVLPRLLTLVEATDDGAATGAPSDSKPESAGVRGW